MKWEAWYFDYINGNKKTYIYVEADSFDEAIAKARRIDLRVIAARVISKRESPSRHKQKYHINIARRVKKPVKRR